MNLGKYPRAVLNLSEGIKDGFSDQEIEDLSRQLEILGFSEWLKWKDDNHQLILKYIEATPSQRVKVKQFKPLMPALAFAAYQQCLAGYQFLVEVENNFITPGQSYRGMAGSAANAHHQVSTAIDHELWPWDGDPFEHGA